MRKLLPIPIVLILTLFTLHVNAQLNIGVVEGGLYGRGSSISVPISIPSNVNCFSTSNVFELYLSDENGNFVSETKIGEIGGFFSTHINGVIPASANAGSGYKLRIKTTSPQATIEYAGTVNITGVQGATVDVVPTIASQVLSSETYGWCGSAVGADKAIVLKPADNSVAQSVTLKNMLTGTTQTYTPTALGFSLDHLAVGYYTVTVSGTASSGTEQIKSVKTYLLLNAPSKVNIQSGGTDFGCIDPETGTGADISYSVNVTGETGIQNNYPGSTYLITWGDGTEDRFTHCELMAAKGVLNHNYKKTSCGEPPIDLGNGSTKLNSFRVSVTTINPFCQSSPVSATTYPQIFSRPVAHIDPIIATTACLNIPIAFSNKSTGGNNSDCSLGMQWKWYIDDVLVSESEAFTYPGFTTPGIHKVQLIANNDVGICRPSEDVRMLCVQAPPKPEFKFNGAQGAMSCGPLSIKPTNTSVIDANCNTENTYLWTITGGTVEYENGTNETSAEPEFRFTTPGFYKVSLSVNTASCGTVTAPEQIVIINGPPTAVLSGDATVCNLTAYDFNDTTSGPTKTELTGTQETLAETYTWTVSGGDYEFSPGFDLHSQYPQINFKEYTTYTVTVVHKNNCGTATDTQLITFKPSPVVNPGTYTPVCYNDAVNLQGTITGTVDSYGWVGGGGTFSPNRNTLNATYTPSDDERAAGKIELTLRANTPLDAPCNIIEAFVTIAIKPTNVITTEASKSICNGKAVDYTPAAQTGSTFKWTVTGSVNAGGFVTPGSGTAISDVLTTTNPALAGSVTYTIVPVLDGCDGNAFELTVTIAADPTATASAANATICNGSPAGITIITAQTGLKYLWTSTASGGQITGNTRNTAAPEDINQIDDVLINNGTATGTVTYVITPVNENGCSGQPVTVSVSVKSAPVITNNSITGNQSVCEGTPSAGLTGTLPSGGGGVYTYQWQSSPDGVTWTDISGATAINYNPGIITQTTQYRRLVILPNCNGTLEFPGNTVSVTVNYNAKAEFSPVSDKGCVPFRIDAANITTTPYPDRNGVYTWYVNDVEIGQGVSFPGYTISNENESVTIKLRVTSSKGCDPSEMSHTFSSERNIVASFTQDKTEGCGPLTVNFVNKSNLLVNTAFAWDFGNGTSYAVNPPPITFLPDPTGKDKTYTITLIATSDCGISTPFTSTVLVQAPTKSMFKPSKTTGCSPLMVNFINTSPVAANTTYTYEFGDNKDTTVNNRNPVSHVYTVADTAEKFVVKMTTNGPCGIDTSSYTIVVSPSTTVAALTVNGTDKRGCAPFTVPFFNASSGGETFVYDFDDETTATTITPPERVMHTFTKPGMYTVKLTAIGCSSSTDTVTIEVLAQPEVSFTSRRNEDCTCLDVKFTNTSVGGVAYLWDFGDGVTSIEANPSHIYAATGVYNVKLTATNQNGCKDVSVNEVTVTGIPGTLFMPNSFIPDSPNPELRLFRAKGFGLKSWRFSIFDKWGEMLWETTSLNDGKPAEGWDGTFKGAQMPQGVYFWKADVQFLNGTGWQGMSYGGTPKKTGIVNLIR
ncbi:PKD domain-containing protein [Pedobacter ginsengisoli]|uniref:PKD domain-containing protein n=1 Tax=Pedobacter ginsengisoli TaxID=363852 RepID=UPI00254B654D|nr:PKD domain-containing protein [Pedobacter ginsengisoli]